MISNRSRYADATVGLVDGSRGPVVTIMPKGQVPRAFEFTYMSLEHGDRLDLIAHRIFGDDTLWWRIADANPEILDWSHVTYGTVLRIPSA